MNEQDIEEYVSKLVTNLVKVVTDKSKDLKFKRALNIIICCARTPYNEVTEVMLFRNSRIRAEVI